MTIAALATCVSACLPTTPAGSANPPTDDALAAALASEATKWTKHAANPLYANYPPDPNVSLVGDPAVVYRNGMFYLYYPTLLFPFVPDADPGVGPCDFKPGPSCPWMLELATSPDGVTWTKFDRGTISRKDDYVLMPDSKTSWDSATIETPTVLYDEEARLFKLWYTGTTHTPPMSYHIGYATSTDGIHWTKYDDPASQTPPFLRSDPVMSPRADHWDNYGVHGPTVLKEGAVFKMWYTGIQSRALKQRLAIGYAESRDGIHWARRDAPVLEPSDDEGDLVDAPAVVRVKDYYEMWYYASDRGIRFAVSRDGITWFKARHIVLPQGQRGSWDDAEASSMTVAVVGGTYWMYYVGSRCPLDEERRPAKDCAVALKLGLATKR